MTVAIAPLLVFVLGVLIYALSTNAKVQEVGRAMVWCGLLAALLLSGGEHLRL